MRKERAVFPGPTSGELSQFVPENQPEKESVYKTLSAPIDAQVEITTACNNICGHCYNYWRGKDSPEATLTEEQLFHVLEELDKNRVFQVTFTGGEPFLFKELTLRGIEWAKERGIAPTLNTNLTTVTPEDAYHLKEAGVEGIVTSVLSFKEATHDSITQREGSFRKTLQGIKACLEAELVVRVNMVLIQANQADVLETGKWTKDLGAKFFSATKAAPPLSCADFSRMVIGKDALKRSLEDLLCLEEDYHLDTDVLISYPLCAVGDGERFKKYMNRGCVGAIVTCTIGANGEVRPCSHADESYGNILEEPLVEVWKKMKDWRDGNRLPEKCLEGCEYFEQCGAGCRMEAKYYGDIKGMDPLASRPSDVISRPSPEVISPPPPDFLEKPLIVKPKLKARKEDFGGIVIAQRGLPLFLNKDAYEVILHLRKKALPFSLREVINDLPLSEDSLDFFNVLFRKGVLEET